MLLVPGSRVVPRTPWTAASVCWCLVLFVNFFFCDYSGSSYTREELINIRATIPVDLFPTFTVTSAEILDILVNGVLTFVQAAKCRRTRGRRAGALRRRGHHTALPGIFLANVRSLANKMYELQVLLRKNRLFIIFWFVLHGDVAVWINPGLCAAAGRLSNRQSGPRHETLRQSERVEVYVSTLTVAGEMT